MALHVIGCITVLFVSALIYGVSTSAGQQHLQGRNLTKSDWKLVLVVDEGCATKIPSSQTLERRCAEQLEKSQQHAASQSDTGQTRAISSECNAFPAMQEDAMKLHYK
eukprot:scaffold544312_cov41-Prasinocladus_malaysianus.AAC.1